AGHPTMLKAVSEDGRAIARADAPIKGHVGIVTGGGSGHLPLFLGYVGTGLCTAVAVGNVFASPSPEQILAATRAANGGAGVLYLYGNYGGDVMNFDLAGDLAAGEIETNTVVGIDDVASAPPARSSERRGVAGLFFAYKCAGAMAERGASLADVAAAARSAVANTRSMGVGLSPTILPAAGKPTFELGPDEMALGVGIHGSRGCSTHRLDHPSFDSDRRRAACPSRPSARARGEEGGRAPRPRQRDWRRRPWDHREPRRRGRAKVDRGAASGVDAI